MAGRGNNPGSTPDLRAYLLNELNVGEIMTESFERKITQQFLSIQSDDWFIKVYEYLLSGHEALWRPPGRAGETGKLSKPRRSLRLEDNSLVAPFRCGAGANTFLPSERAL